MKLVIDIDDGLYKAICDCDRFNVQNLSHFAIKNGTPYEERLFWRVDRHNRKR